MNWWLALMATALRAEPQSSQSVPADQAQSGSESTLELHPQSESRSTEPCMVAIEELELVAVVFGSRRSAVLEAPGHEVFPLLVGETLPCGDWPKLIHVGESHVVLENESPSRRHGRPTFLCWHAFALTMSESTSATAEATESSSPSPPKRATRYLRLGCDPSREELRDDFELFLQDSI